MFFIMDKTQNVVDWHLLPQAVKPFLSFCCCCVFLLLFSYKVIQDIVDKYGISIMEMAQPGFKAIELQKGAVHCTLQIL